MTERIERPSGSGGVPASCIVAGVAVRRRLVLGAVASLAENVFWQVAGQVTLGTTSAFHGTIRGQTAIVMETGAVFNGRALARTEITPDAATVTQPLD